MADPQGYTCPGCGWQAELALAGGHAFCSNEDCKVFSWDPTATLVELIESTSALVVPGG